jgi:hypothetical protein
LIIYFLQRKLHFILESLANSQNEVSMRSAEMGKTKYLTAMRSKSSSKTLETLEFQVNTFGITVKNKKIVSTDVCVNTQADGFFNLTIEERVKILESALLNISKFYRPSNGIEAILTAPEYFFAKSNIKETRHYSEEDKDTILAQIRFLSARYPSVLIITRHNCMASTCFRYNNRV